MKPEKIKMTEGVTHNRWISGYNKAIDDYELWLKEAISVDKISRVIEMFDMEEMYGSEVAKAIFNLTKQEG